MKLRYLLAAGVTLALLAVVGARASQRIRVIDVDGAATPAGSQVLAVTNTPAVSNTQTFTANTGTATLTITPLTATVTNSVGGSWLVVTALTVNVSTVVTNVSGTGTFTIAGCADTNQLNAIINNSSLFQKLLGSY